MSTHLCPALGPILLYSNTPSPAEAQAIAIVQSRQPCIDRPLRLIVLQTPLEIPNEREVTTLHNQFSGHGVEVLAMDAGLQTRGDAHDPEVIAVIRSADIVLVTGGEPARMERVIRDTPALLALQEARAGGVLIGGGSAGAMIFGQGMLDGPRDSRIPTVCWAGFRTSWLRPILETIRSSPGSRRIQPAPFFASPMRQSRW